MVRFIYKTLILFVLVGCGSTTLDSDLIYTSDLDPIIIEKFGIDKEDLKTNKLKVYFRSYEKENEKDLLEKPVVKLVIESDGKYYSFNGNSSFVKETDFNEETYYLSVNGYNKTFLQFTLLTSNKSFLGFDRSFTENIKSTYSKSEMTTVQFDNLFEKGSKKEFFPQKVKTINNFNDFSDYWLSYFGKDDIVNERKNQKRELDNQRNLQNIENEKNRISRENRQKRTRDLCKLITDFDLNKIKKLGRGVGYIPKNQQRSGFMDSNIFLKYYEGSVYTGPFVLTSEGEIYAGTKDRNIAPLYISKNKSIDDLKKFLVSCN